MAGTLYVVATPIGNLKDITFRALEILKEVDLILAEDTRTTGNLLKHYEIKSNFLSYNQHSFRDPQKLTFILSQLSEGKNVALVTDAGTPAVSDPGGELIDFLVKNNPEIKVIPIPGASALTTAMSVSGLKLNHFVFLGFMPKKKRAKIWKWLKEGKVSFGFFESPFRIIKTLEEIKKEFGDSTQIFIARELTKLHETLYRGKVGEVLTKLKSEKVRGEIVVIVEV